MRKNKLKYNYVLVSQFEQRIRIVIGSATIQLEPTIETNVKLTNDQKKILDNLISSTYNNKIAFITKKEEGN